MGNTILEVIMVAKQGMKRPEVTHTKQRNELAAVPELQGKAKHGKAHAAPIIAGTASPSQKVYHTNSLATGRKERAISSVYPAIDNDLARDNIENDMTEADLQDFVKK